MIYIVEGINKVGKTTYCLSWAKESGNHYIRLPRPDNHIQAMRDPIIFLKTVIIANSSKDWIIDRCYPSEFVYKEYPFSEYQELEKLFKGKACILYCESPKNVVLDRWKNLNVVSDYATLKCKYEYFLEYTTLPVQRLLL